MSNPKNIRPLPPAERIPLHARAADNLAFIRTTMANSTEFTGVSGVGMMGMGVVGLIGAWLATRWESAEVLRRSPQAYTVSDQWWLDCWTGVAIIGCALGVLGLVFKSRKHGTPVLFGAGRKFLLNFSPAIVAGIALSQMLYVNGLDRYLPAVWLLMYGVAVISGGAFSIPIIPVMGVCFMLAGVLTFFLPQTVLNAPGTVRPTDIVLAASFGGLHLGFGALIARKHGG
jgi:hypothetical protein